MKATKFLILRFRYFVFADISVYTTYTSNSKRKKYPIFYCMFYLNYFIQYASEIQNVLKNDEYVIFKKRRKITTQAIMIPKCEH